jgi:hypothetical protein
MKPQSRQSEDKATPLGSILNDLSDFLSKTFDTTLESPFSSCIHSPIVLVEKENTLNNIALGKKFVVYEI